LRKPIEKKEENQQEKTKINNILKYYKNKNKKIIKNKRNDKKNLKEK